MNLQQKKQKYATKIFRSNPEEKQSSSYRFSLFSANIKKFLPSIPSQKYEELFQEVLYYQLISGAEQYDREYLLQSKIINHSNINLNSGITNSPTIFATFHLGSYRILNSFLYEQGFKVVLIIDESVYLNQMEDMLNAARTVTNGKSDSDLIILNVKDRSSIFKLKQLLANGYIMTVYLDGNTGINIVDQDFSKGFIPINFLGNSVYVKNGVGKLAALMNAEIVPVVAYRDKADTSYIEFHKEINALAYSSKEAFANEAIAICYQKLEEKILQYPTQWECWLYIHKWFSRKHPNPYIKFNKVSNRFNTERFTTFSLTDSQFLFDLYDYQSYPITKVLSDAIAKNNFDGLDGPLKNELIYKNIIV